MKIYVAGPYTAGSSEVVEANVRKAIINGLIVWFKGHSSYIPHLNHLVSLTLKDLGMKDLSHAEWLRWDDTWLECCDAILVYEGSPGADAEREKATNRGLTVYTHVDEVPFVDLEKEELKEELMELAYEALRQKGVI